MRSISLALLFIFFQGCGVTVLTKGGSRLSIIEGDVPKGCRSVGSISASAGGLGRGANDPVLEYETVLRNKAALLGANKIKVMYTSTNGVGVIRGGARAYRCK